MWPLPLKPHPQVLALMHQHHSFLGSIDRKKEAGVLAEQIAEVERQRKSC